jgi:hypothetical protein
MSSPSLRPARWARRALLAALFAGVICTGLARAADGFVTVTSLDQLRGYLGQSGVKVRLAPGTYRLDTATTPNFLDVTGSDAHYDFTGVKLEVDTALFAQFKKVGTNFVMLSGDRIVFDGLSLETIGNHPPPGGCRALSIMGRGVIVRNVSLLLAGSYPYGYGSFFGIGSGASINPQKLNGIRIGGIDDQVINCPRDHALLRPRHLHSRRPKRPHQGLLRRGRAAQNRRHSRGEIRPRLRSRLQAIHRPR